MARFSGLEVPLDLLLGFVEATLQILGDKFVCFVREKISAAEKSDESEDQVDERGLG
jgi:hypothetical protein